MLGLAWTESLSIGWVMSSPCDLPTVRDLPSPSVAPDHLLLCSLTLVLSGEKKKKWLGFGPGFPCSQGELKRSESVWVYWQSLERGKTQGFLNPWEAGTKIKIAIWPGPWEIWIHLMWFGKGSQWSWEANVILWVCPLCQFNGYLFLFCFCCFHMWML